MLSTRKLHLPGTMHQQCKWRTIRSNVPTSNILHRLLHTQRIWILKRKKPRNKHVRSMGLQRHSNGTRIRKRTIHHNHRTTIWNTTILTTKRNHKLKLESRYLLVLLLAIKVETSNNLLT